MHPKLSLLEGELLELGILADMVQKLSASERALQPSQGSSIAERIRSCRERLGTWKHLADNAPTEAHLDQTTGNAASGPLQTSTVDGSVPVVASQTGRRVDITPVRGGAQGTTQTVQPKATFPTSGGAPSPCTTKSPRQPPLKPTAPPGASFQVKKPSSIRVAQVARDTPPATSTGVVREIGKNVSCAIYNILETIANLTASSAAHAFLRIGTEMVSIANVGTKLSFPPKLVRQNCQGSMTANVMASGIALNQRVLPSSSNRNTSSSMLIFPMRNGLGNNSPAIGVVQVSNKHGGSGQYSEVDENVVNIGAAFIGELLSKYSMVDWTDAFYDPITQHIAAPFAPKGVSSMRFKDDEGTIFITATDGSASSTAAKPLVDALDTFVPPQLIHRVTLPLTQTTGGPIGLGAAPSLREVDTYMSNLHDCWRRSVEMNVTQVQVDRQKSKEMKQLRDDLNHHRSKCARIEEELRLHTLDSSDYHKEYSALKEELDNYLRIKGRLD